MKKPKTPRYDDIFWPRLLFWHNAPFFMAFPFLLPLLVLRLACLLLFILFFRVFRGRSTESDLVLSLFCFLCLGLVIRKRRQIPKILPRTLFVMNHVHYLDNYPFKAIGLHKVGGVVKSINARKFAWIDRMLPIRVHSGRLVEQKAHADYLAMVKGVRERGESYGICPEGTVKKDHRAVLRFHTGLFRFFDRCVPVSIEYTYLIPFRYGYQYPAYFLMDYLGVMLSPLTLCTVKVHDAIKIDPLTFAAAAEEARQVITRAIGGYEADYLYTDEDYEKRLAGLPKRR